MKLTKDDINFASKVCVVTDEQAESVRNTQTGCIYFIGDHDGNGNALTFIPGEWCWNGLFVLISDVKKGEWDDKK